MTKVLWVFAVLCGLLGCVDQAAEESTGVRVDITAGVNVGVDTFNTVDGEDVVPDSDDPPPIGDVFYRFVRITDLSTDASSDDVGSDIDAVGIRSAVTGAVQWATTIEQTAGNVQNDPALALGEPSAFPGWMSGDVTVCGVDAEVDGFVSLGRDGTLSLGFGNIFTSGDIIEVYEVGNCEFFFDGNIGIAVGEPVLIDVAVTSDIATAFWINVQTIGVSPLISGTVP